MENIRITELEKVRSKNYFGFSAFLTVLFSLLIGGFTFLMVMLNIREGVSTLQVWPAIVALVLSGLLLLSYLGKRRWIQSILVLFFIALNVFMLTKVINLLDIANASRVRATEIDKTLPFVKQVLDNQSLLLIIAIGTGIGLLAILLFVFNIVSLRNRGFVDGTASAIAYNAKLEEYKNDPSKSQKVFTNKTKALLKDRRYIEFTHELGVKCIVDDPSYNDKYFGSGESYFVGNVFSLGIRQLFWWILNGVTFGILIPWTTSWKYRYYASRCTYSGKKVTFDGKGIQLLGKWILWGLLTIVTAGIYAFFMAIALKKWVVKHQHFEGEENVESEYTGTTFGRGLLGLGLLLLTLLTLGLATPYSINRMAKYDMEHTVISGHKLVFTGTGMKLLGKFIKWWLLSIITLGIYAIFVLPMNMMKYKTQYTKVCNVNYDPEKDPR